MPEFLTTRGVTSKIESIIGNAKDYLYIISPYLNFIPDSFIQKIQWSVNKGVRVTLVFRDFDKIHENEVKKLESIKGGLNVFQNSDLHAKAYFNEKEAIITSFNLSSRSEQNNIEFGIFFTVDDSSKVFKSLIEETELIIEESENFSLRPDEGGHCIRCNNFIEFDPAKPYCYSCYLVWHNYDNPNYSERYCHMCGKNGTTSFTSPFCSDCV